MYASDGPKRVTQLPVCNPRFDGDEALAKTTITDYGVVALDRGLPGIHGEEDTLAGALATRMRDQNSWPTART